MQCSFMDMEKNRTRIWRGTEQEHEEGQIKRNGEGPRIWKGTHRYEEGLNKNMERDTRILRGHNKDIERDTTKIWRGTQQEHAEGHKKDMLRDTTRTQGHGEGHNKDTRIWRGTFQGHEERHKKDMKRDTRTC